MSDSPSRGQQRRGRARISSRASSARSSAVYDDHLHPLAHHGAHGLRPVESRFSLNEQFAVTRREYEFGYDDNSSVFERISMASDLEGDDFGEDTVKLETAQLNGKEIEDGGYMEEDYYDILCLPRNEPVTPQQIRAAYYRLFPLLHQDGQKAALQAYFGRVQRAFETLIDPAKRAEYDLRDRDESPADSEAFDEEAEDVIAYEMARADGPWQASREGGYTTSDLGVRFDASRALQPSWRGGRRRRCLAVKPLDFSLSHSVTVGIPALGQLTERKARWIYSLIKSRTSMPGPDVSSAVGEKPAQTSLNTEIPFRFSPPTLTVSGSVYGLMDEIFLTPISLLSDRYQPLLPQTIPRHRVIQLAENKMSPLIALKLRQEISHRTWTGDDTQRGVTVVEFERDVLPERALTTRVSHTLFLPNDPQPTYVEASVKSGRRWMRTKPRVAVGVQREVLNGTAFARLDSGDWTLWPGDTCKFFTEFSKINRKFFYTEFPLKTTPSLELGYTTAAVNRSPFTCYDDTPRGESGIRGLDHEINYAPQGSWTVSAAATPDTVAGYLRYARDLALAVSSGNALPAQNRSRLEIELCSNMLFDQYLAVRNLWRVGKSSRLGLEAGVSLYNFHVSVYWSRLGQRISVPFLVSPRAYLTSEVVFWAGVVPFLAVAGLQLMNSRKKAAKRRQLIDLKKDELAEYVARKRAEADELAVLMSAPVEARQAAERQRGGLVILSAKYGVKDSASSNGWAAEEVADVTIAMASLVDDGKLVIPRNLRKGNLLGFWDPSPLAKKALHVKYLYKGKEETVEVFGRDELVLPLAGGK